MERRALYRRLSIVLAILVLAVGLSPVIAHADGWRTATAQGSGPSWSAGEAAAQTAARNALVSQASQAGETCTNITSSATWVYTAPGGAAYVFNGTATGYCAVPPPYVVPRSATRQGQGSIQGAAHNNGFAAAQSAILASGISCTGYSSSDELVWVAPQGVWYIMNVTVNAVCTN
jgi:hypothetical protein